MQAALESRAPCKTPLQWLRSINTYILGMPRMLFGLNAFSDWSFMVALMIEDVCDENPNSNSFDLGCYNSKLCYDRRYWRTFIPGMMVTFEKHHLCMPCKSRSGEKSEISATLNFWQLVIYLQKDRLQVGSWVFDRSSRWEKSARDAAGNLQSEVGRQWWWYLCF